MAPPENKPGHPPDVTAQIVTKETHVTTVLRGSREMAVRNVLKGGRSQNTVTIASTQVAIKGTVQYST